MKKLNQILTYNDHNRRTWKHQNHCSIYQCTLCVHRVSRERRNPLQIL